MPLATGCRLGPYEVTGPLGAGGMGEVYRARDRRLERDVAVKVLPDHLAEDPQALARFVRETKALAALSHPNLLAIFDTGDADGIRYAVTELLEGETLRTMVERGPTGWRKVAEIGAALADGLAAAHSKGITHRDVKPENLFLTSSGQAKVLDFGVASVERIPSANDFASTVTSRTLTGMVVGTPGYFSPEQIRGEPAGPLSDIFSMGCVLYEMLSGQRAFAGATSMETISMILRDEPANLGAIGIQAPAEMRNLVARCLSKRAAMRMPGAQELAAQLRAQLSAPSGAGIVTAASIDSIAVLPFENANDDPDSEYLSDGITENILNSLAQIPHLRVIPRSTVFRYKRSEKDPQAVGQELNVRVVLTGRVRLRGETLVVGTELLDVQVGSQLWGERYSRKMSDIFALEEEISQKISGSLRVRLGGEDKGWRGKRVTADPEAYQLYLKGRHHWTKRTPDDLLKGAHYFQQAIDKDPSYVVAYSGLADCYSVIGCYSILPGKVALARAKAAAAAAVAFDEELAEGHASLGIIRAYCDWDWEAADREFARARELNPGYFVTAYWHAMSLASSGRYQEAEAMVHKGMELEPLSPLIAHVWLMNTYFSRDYGKAIERAHESIAIYPNLFLLRFWLGLSYLQERRFEEAIEALEVAVTLSEGKLTWVVGSLGHAYAAAGNRAGAERLLRELQGKLDSEVVDFIALVLVCWALGDQEGALGWVEKAFEAKGFISWGLNGDPRFDPLRGEPRFQAVIRQMNLRP